MKNSSGLGSSKTAKPNPFTTFRTSIEEGVQRARSIIEEISDVENKGTLRGKDSQDVIRKRSSLRAEFTLINDWVVQMDELYNSEKSKRKSKFSKIELDAVSEQLKRMKREVADVSMLSRTSHVKTVDSMAKNRLKGIEESGLINNNPNGEIIPQEEMTTDHLDQHKAILERDKRADERIAGIGKGVEMLGHLAGRQGEILREQNIELDGLENHVLKNQSQVEEVNSRMKEVLSQIGKFDKVCCDLLCIGLMVGLIIVIVKIEEGELGRRLNLRGSYD